MSSHPEPDRHATATLDGADIYARAIAEFPVGVCVISWGDFIFRDVNQAFADMLGYEPHEIIGRPNTDFLHPDHLAWDADIKRRINAGEPLPPRLERTLLHRDGSTIFAEVRPVRVTCDDGTSVVVSMYVDITEKKATAAERDQLAERVARARDRLEYLYREAVIDSHIGHGVLSTETHRYISVNEAFARMLGYRPEEMVGRSNLDFVPPDQLDEDRRLQRRIAAGGPLPAVARRRFAHRDGSMVWLDVHPVAVTDEDGREVVVSQYIDVTEAVRAQEARASAEAESERILADLRFRSTHDLLTGLRNRHSLLDEIERRLQDPSRRIAVLYLDLDNFKHINDAYSHHAGDKVLTAFGAMLRQSLRHHDECGRIGGDEFVVISGEVTGLDDAVAVAQRLQDIAGATTLRAGPATISPRFSVGIALSRPGVDAQTLLGEADAALRSSKMHGKDRWEVYDERTREDAQHRLEVAAALRSALRRGDLHAHFQPIVDMRDRRLVGYEALARWRSGGKWVPAASWIDIAGEAGLLPQVSRQIVAEATAKLSRIPDPLTVAVNASAVELSQPDFADWVERCLERSGAVPSRLTIEITEQSLINAPAATRKHLNGLVSQGVEVHLDDFGTGYSSIAHLCELPVTGIKLDQSFVSGIDSGPYPHQDVIPALAKLARQLRLSTVAEGVETTEQAEMLIAAGWCIGQGYLFGSPEPDPQAPADWRSVAPVMGPATVSNRAGSAQPRRRLGDRDTVGP